MVTPKDGHRVTNPRIATEDSQELHRKAESVQAAGRIAKRYSQTIYATLVLYNELLNQFEGPTTDCRVPSLSKPSDIRALEVLLRMYAQGDLGKYSLLNDRNGAQPGGPTLEFYSQSAEFQTKPALIAPELQKALDNLERRYPSASKSGGARESATQKFIRHRDFAISQGEPVTDALLLDKVLLELAKEANEIPDWDLGDLKMTPPPRS